MDRPKAARSTPAGVSPRGAGDARFPWHFDPEAPPPVFLEPERTKTPSAVGADDVDQYLSDELATARQRHLDCAKRLQQATKDMREAFWAVEYAEGLLNEHSKRLLPGHRL